MLKPMIADTLEFFESKRKLIISILKDLPPIPGAGGEEPLERIVEFAMRGKMIRGCLVFLGAETAHPAAAGADDITQCAAAMELFQAGLLAHDDIMDRDETRRGAPTIHARYASEARAAGSSDPLHAGEALGICLGDLCYFEAYALLARGLGPAGAAGAAGPALSVGASRSSQALSLLSSGLAEVAVAQMSDVHWGSGGTEPPEEAILEMYRGKTAHYSFSLPLSLGTLCVGDGSLVEPLYRLGESLGILFQLRDDELGLFGDEASIGKGVGSDLREGKKTLFRARLMAAAPDRERERLERAFRPGERDRAELALDVDYIRGLAAKTGVSESIAVMKREAEKEARTIIGALPDLDSGTAAVFEGLVDFVSRRDK
jgi:geranylgeranyl diphosphate synthase, type I